MQELFWQAAGCSKRAAPPRGRARGLRPRELPSQPRLVPMAE
ncbi:conserved domain protein [Actinomyces sp. oral taxon 170 str. F0386]|nr:conserved domain protein [Actinomyces sp. oral taxon 170 str. F0386]